MYGESHSPKDRKHIINIEAPSQKTRCFFHAQKESGRCGIKRKTKGVLRVLCRMFQRDGGGEESRVQSKDSAQYRAEIVDIC